MLPSRAAWVVVAVTIVCRSVLSTMVALLLWGVLPGLVGFQTSTVMSGSMTPRLQVGDAVVMRPVAADQLSVGQVLLFDDPDEPGRLRLHRLIEIDPDGRLVTKGDANSTPDSSTITIDAVHGAGFLRVPFAGLPTYWYRTGQVAPLAGSVVAVLVLLAGVRLGRLLEDPEERGRRRHRGARMPSIHRATAAGVALAVLTIGAVQAPRPASAMYSATTAPAASAWSLCTDRVPTWTTVPQVYWGFGTGTDPNVTDLSSSGDTGILRPGATRAGCSGGFSPSATLSGSGVVTGSTQRAFPGSMTVATWFKASSADGGGVLTDFGSSSTATASAAVDRILYIGSDGSVGFGTATVQVAGILVGGYQYCTSPSGYADGAWHLAVATLSTSGCTLRIDNGTAVTRSFTLSITLLGYSGYWRAGYDPVPSGAPAAPSRAYFKGSLDETQVYGSVLSAAEQTAIWSRGH